MKFTIVAENDISKWKDDTGKRYHFPRRYKSKLLPGTQLIHYKGRLQDKDFAASRRSLEPHYFAVSIAGEHYPDKESEKGDLFVQVTSFRLLPEIVPIRQDGQLIEVIPESRKKNYWRDGVRVATSEIFHTIVERGGLLLVDGDDSDPEASDDLVTAEEEGGRRKVYSSRFERKPSLRKKAILIHGNRCAACELLMSETYGTCAENYIQIHHKRPLSHNGGPTLVDPKTDLVPLCPNCHAVVHLGERLKTVNEVRALLGLAASENHD